MVVAHRSDFWEALDSLVSGSRVVIDRPRGYAHPRFPGFVYPLDYGYLDGTTSVDGEGVDVWLGEAAMQHRVCGVIASVDLDKKDSELKLLLDCTPDEMDKIEDIYNTLPLVRGLLLVRPQEQ